MFRLKRLAAILVLAIVATFCAPQAFAGETSAPPGIDGDIQAPGITGDMQTPGYTGDILCPGLAVFLAALFG